MTIEISPTPSKESINESTLLHFPSEILSQIASHLSNKDLYSCLFLHRSISIHFLSPLWKTIDFTQVTTFVDCQSPRVVQFKHSAIDTGALSRNGRFIRSIKAVPVNWLVKYFGPHVCPFLETLEIYQFNIGGTYNQDLALADLSTLSTYLQQFSNCGSSILQRLVLSIFDGRPERLKLDAFPDVLKAIPISVQELCLSSLYSWRRAESNEPCLYQSNTDDRYKLADQYFQKLCKLDLQAKQNFSTATVTTASQASLILHTQSHKDIHDTLSLPGIKKLVFNYLHADCDEIVSLIQACCNLESIAFFGCYFNRSHILTQLLRTHCPQLSSLTMSCYSEHRFICPDIRDLFLLLCASINGWKSLAFSSYKGFTLSDNFRLGLFLHAGTIETLYLYKCHWMNKDKHDFLCSAPRLKHFTVVDETCNRDNHFSPREIEFGDWECTDLQVFRNSIRTIPRPDLDTDTLFMTTVDKEIQEASHRIQRIYYRQLGRLTKLKELVLGEFEVNEFKESPTGIPIQKGKRCLAMTLESGMDLLKDLSQLQRLGLRGLHVPGFMASERDREWIKQCWPLLDTNYCNSSRYPLYRAV